MTHGERYGRKEKIKQQDKNRGVKPPRHVASGGWGGGQTFFLNLHITN